MHWLYLTISSAFEVGWLVSLKSTHGFTRLKPMFFYAFFGAGSAYFLSLSMKTLPMVTAYSMWIGGAIAGSVIIDIYYYKQPYSIANLFFIAMIIIGVAGNKIMTAAPGG